MNEKRPRIAIFVGQADESTQSRFITGFSQVSISLEWDTFVFSMYHKYQNTTEREKGESNIFNLMDPASFDAAVILEDTIQTADAASRLEEKLHREFNGPVLVYDKDSPYFPSIFAPCRPSIFELVDHLVKTHGYKDFAFLSGKKWHKHAQMRLQAVRDALAQYDLTLPEERVIYGDFWYQSGELAAESLLSAPSLPDVVICANDAMAIGLCKALTEREVSVPEDIAVVSYDSTDEGQTAPKAITSALIPAEKLGAYAAGFINDSLHGRETPPFQADPIFVPGETCGCKCHTSCPTLKRDHWSTEISEEGFFSVNNTMADDLLDQTDLQGLLGTIYSYAFQLKGAERFHLCLCEPWRFLGTEQVTCPNNGYTEKMIYAVRYNRDRMDGLVSLDETFDLETILPGLTHDRTRPVVLFFTPIFYEGHCFGYGAVDYALTPRSYDETYRQWATTVSKGFEGLRRYLEAQFLQEELRKVRSSKSSAVSAFESLNDQEKDDYRLVSRILDDNLFTYHFQPIVNTVDGGIYSYEALMRSAAERPIPPLVIIKYAEMQGRISDVERATFFNVLSFIENNPDPIGKARVFINSIPGARLSSEDQARVEDWFYKLSDTVVVELTEESELADDDLERLKEMFRRNNIKIAVDDYGTGYSNVSNLLRYMPDYVKIDRSLLSEIHIKPQKQHFVREIIGFCHDNGILALAEGVETPEELRSVIHLGADLIQGYYTGRPSPELIPSISEDIRKEIRAYHREYLQGTTEQTYVAGKTNRVSMASLIKDNVTEIVLGRGTMIYKDITVFGSPGLKTNIHITVEPEYTGRLTLENAWLSSSKDTPAIKVGENCDLTLVVVGDNVLRSAGILVPPTSRLTVDGTGDLKIDLHSPEFYGIGNRPSAQHGELIFSLSGVVDISGHGMSGTCIGSGMGGTIRIHSGQYILDTNGHTVAAIGSLDGDTDIQVHSCSCAIEFNASPEGVGIGSLQGSAKISIESLALNLYADGTDVLGIGTLKGPSADLNMNISSAYMSMSANTPTGMGAPQGRFTCDTLSSVIKMELSGGTVLAISARDEASSARLNMSDVKWTIHSEYPQDHSIRTLVIQNSKTRFLLNGQEISHTSED